MTTPIPRGIHLANPGNVRHSDTHWIGQATDQPDPSFVAFTDPVYGIRACARILLNYGRLHGLKTIREIVTRWAPAEDNNDVEAYVDDVAQRMGVGPDDVLDLENSPRLRELVSAIIKHENGAQPYTLDVLSRGVSMAIA